MNSEKGKQSFPKNANARSYPPYPPGTRLISLREEIDTAEDAQRITPAGSIWRVREINGQDRYVTCEVTGACIVPTVHELHTQFCLSLLGWHFGAEIGREYTVVACRSLAHSFVTVRTPDGSWARYARELILTCASPPGMRYEPHRRGFFPVPILRIATWSPPIPPP